MAICSFRQKWLSVFNLASFEDTIPIRFQSIIRNLDAGDALELLALIQGNMALKARIISEITRFLHSEMNLSLAGN